MGIVLGWRSMLPRQCSLCGPCLMGHFSPSDTALARVQGLIKRPVHRLHLTEPVSETAVCYGYTPFLAPELGLPAPHLYAPDPHLSAPTEGCTCGYYVLWRPDITWGGVASPFCNFQHACWAYVVGIGKAILHVHGARLERYRILALFPPVGLAGQPSGPALEETMAIVEQLGGRFPVHYDDWRLVDLPGGYYEDRRYQGLVHDLIGGAQWREALARWLSA